MSFGCVKVGQMGFVPCALTAYMDSGLLVLKWTLVGFLWYFMLSPATELGMHNSHLFPIALAPQD